MSSRLVPKLFSCFQEGYTLQKFARDGMAGVIVGIVALPLAIAFAIASGVKPEQGLFTAIVAGFVISALSGSRVQIGGPTGAFIVVVFGIVQQHGYQGLAVATIMAGGLLVVMGIARMGAVIKFIPYPMTIGFTSGIALIIAVTQIKEFLGLTTTAPASDLVHRLIGYYHDLPSLNPAAIFIGGFSLVIILVWPLVTKKIPGSIIAILLGTFLAHVLDLKLATIGSEFGSVPNLLPAPRFPDFDWAMIPDLVPAALTIALLGAIESLLSAVVADGMTGTRHRSNMELVAQGIANLVSPLFGGIPATGAIARTVTNIKNGGRTPVAGIVHVLTLLLIMILFGRWVTLIPLACLAAVLLVVAYHMSEWRHFLKLFQAPRSDVLVMLSTFGLTVFVDLTVAIETGVVLSSLLFMSRMAQATEFRSITSEVREDYDESDDVPVELEQVPAGVEVFEIYGPFFFGAANVFKDKLSIIKRPPKVLILRLRHILTIDATALQALEELIEKTSHEGTLLFLSGVKPQLRETLMRSGLIAKIGEQALFPHIEPALQAARDHLAT